MTEELQKKVDRAIRLIQSAVKDDVVEVSYSGGKDSDVILELTKMAGVKYRAIYKNTTIDPPGTIAHCKAAGAEIMKPVTTFFKLVEKKGMPTMRARFCCEKLKEYKVLDKAIQGIRRSESVKRSARYSEDDPIICRIYGSKKNHVSVILPILSWTDEDVEEFIGERGIKCHPLYYRGGQFDVKQRLGCLGCPLSPKNAIKDFKQYPNFLKAYLKAAGKWWDTHPDTSSRKKFRDVYEVFVHNYYYNTYEAFDKAVHGMMGTIDCKKFIEDTFGIEL